MSTKRIILISGYARSGKDSLATHLKRELEIEGHEARVLKFANALKEALQAALNRVGLEHIDVFTEDEELKKLLRPLLVEFGKFARKMHKDVFVKALIKDMEALFCNGIEVALISDCRYINESEIIRLWAKQTGSLVSRLHISREGLEAANEEERQSIYELNNLDRGFSERTFREGDLFGIEAWAQELVNAGKMPMPDWLKEGNKGAPVDPTKVTAYLPHGVRTSWHGPNGEPLFIDKTKPVFGHTHDPKPAPVEQQLKALWDESLCLDETIDRVSQRVDHGEQRMTRLRDYAVGRTDRLMDKIRELEARIERLEVARG
jgi:hypothetical protein